MLWPFFHNFTDEDATAIATFLKTKSRPVQNLIPPKLAYGLIETIAMKFTRPLPATSPKALTYGDGNFAIGSTRSLADACSSCAINAQWVVLALALVLFVRAGPRPGMKGSIGGVVGLTVAGALLFLLSQWPGIRNMPPDPLVKAVNAGDVKPDTSGMPGERSLRSHRVPACQASRTAWRHWRRCAGPHRG